MEIEGRRLFEEESYLVRSGPGEYIVGSQPVLLQRAS
jgi:hypothetical protein